MKRLITKLMMAVMCLLLSVWSANARIVSYSPTATYTTIAGSNVTVTNAASTSAKTITCISSSSASYLSLNGSTASFKATLDLSTERIDSVLIIWLSNTTNQTIPYVWSDTDITPVSTVATLTNGGVNQTSVLATSGITNCPGQMIKFPAGSKVKSFLMQRIMSNLTTTVLNTNYSTVNVRLNSTSTPYSVAVGTSSTAYVGSVTLYISTLAPSISSFSVLGVPATIDDAAGTIIATLPYGTSLTSLTPTIALGGTATSCLPASGVAQDFTNSVNYTVSDGASTPTTKTYAVTLTVPATPPAPGITLLSGSAAQWAKAGTAITNIVYNLTNATGASVTGLPTGLSGAFVSTGTNTGTYTISGTVDAGVTPGLFNYTVTATAITGYSGADVTSVGTILVKSTTARQILYLTTAGTVSTTDTQFYPMLNNSPNYIVTLKLAASTAPLASFYDPYDLIVLTESVNSANIEAGALKSVDKPILNFKSFVYAASPKWGWGTPDNGSTTGTSVAVMQPSHPIFAGITPVAGSINILSAVSGTKGIQPADLITLTGSINVATAPKAASGSAIAIHDVPAAVRGVVNSRYLMIPISDLSFGNFTADGQTLLSNAVSYLLNGTQFIAPSLDINSFTVNSVTATIDQTAKTINAQLPIGTGLTALQPTITLSGVGTTVSPASTIATDFTSAVNYTVGDGINSKVYAVTIVEGTTALSQNKLAGITFDGKIIHNNASLDLQVYDIMGRKVAHSNKDINMSNHSNGIYIVKSTAGVLKITM